MSIDWDKLRIFHTVAEAGSLTAAGNALNLSQSAVSRQISGLENGLGIKLFNRHARGLVLTEEGTQLFITSQSIYAQLSAATARIMDCHHGLKGHFKIATTVAFGSVWLPPRLSRLYDKYPDLQLDINLTDGDIDFVMREADASVQLGKKNTSNDLIYDPLFDFKLKIYASKSYLEKFGAPQKLEDLDQHRLLVFGGYSVAPVNDVNWLLRLGVPAGHIRKPYLIMNNAYGLLQSVKNGMGIASLASFIARDHPDLIKLFDDYPYEKLMAYLVYPKSMENSKRIAALREFIQNEMGRRAL